MNQISVKTVLSNAMNSKYIICYGDTITEDRDDIQHILVMFKNVVVTVFRPH